MKTSTLLIIGTIAACLVFSTAGAQNPSTRLFNIYVSSVLNPTQFDQYVSSHTFDQQILTCISNLSSRYQPITENHFNACRSIQDWTARTNCMNQAPPEARAGDWLGSLQLKLAGQPWCQTSSGLSACTGRRTYGRVAWENMLRPFFPLWQQVLRCQ